MAVLHRGHTQQQAMEPAVAYVQKIKQRCDPETYKQFLDILSRYHHAPETIDEVGTSTHFSFCFSMAALHQTFSPKHAFLLLFSIALDLDFDSVNLVIGNLLIPRYFRIHSGRSISADRPPF
jgi:hypothetical protein